MTAHSRSETEQIANFAVLKQAIEDIAKGLWPENQGALKVLHKTEDARDPQNASERIAREIQAMAEIEHPNLLRVLDKDPNHSWFVAEYHRQGTLDKHIDRYTGDLFSTLRAIRPLVEGVARLHSTGLVHRDIKPHNIFIANDGRLVLGDFGLAYSKDDWHTRLTGTFENVGSWDWMPPWATHVRVEEVNPTFDVFSLGKVIWAMLSNVRILKYWYYDHPQYDVTQLFPDSPGINLANELFRKCIVENEAECLKTAEALLKEIEDILALAEKQVNQDRLHKQYRDVFRSGQPTSLGGATERDYFLGAWQSFKNYTSSYSRLYTGSYVDPMIGL